MTRFLQAITLCLLALLPVACTQLQKTKKEEEKKQKVLPPLYLGSVHQVYPQMNCALLRIIGPMPSAGSTLIAHPADGTNSRIANLCVTADKASSNGYIMAEIRSGAVMRGDRVFVYRDLSPVEEMEENEETEDVINELAPDLPSNFELTDEETHQTTPEPVQPTTPEPTGTEDVVTPLQPASGQTPKTKPGKAPSYLDNIPNDINDWD